MESTYYTDCWTHDQCSVDASVLSLSCSAELGPACHRCLVTKGLQSNAVHIVLFSLHLFYEEDLK